MQNNNYRDTFAISQSAIKDFRFKSPKRWKDIHIDRQLDLDKNEETFVFGSLVDTILLTPKEIDKRFYIADVSKIPTATIEKIVKYVYDTSSDDEKKGETQVIDDPELPTNTTKVIFDMTKIRNRILEACDKFEWNQGWKDDTRINKIIEKGETYYSLLNEARGRKVITSEVNLQALDIVNRLRNDPRVSKYFVDKGPYKNIFQLEIFGEYNSGEHFSAPLKCAIDILHIDNELKTLQVCDFKTAHSAYNFLQSIKQFGYCDQLSFYTFMLRNALQRKDFCDAFGVDSTWTILEPINIVIDEFEKLPYVYQYDWKDIDISRSGNTTYLYSIFETNNHNERIKKGWQDLLDEICWHLQNDQWDYPVEIYKTGSIKVNLTNS